MKTLLLLLLAVGGCRNKDTTADSGTTAPATDSAATVDTEDTEPTGPVDADGDGSPETDDCDDDDAAVHPGATEVCNGVDDDCDLSVDEDAGDLWHDDADEDGHGDPDTAIQSCDAPSGTVARADDCDDDDPTINPDGVELCNGVDDDCDTETDEDDAADATAWHTDQDGDGYGDPDATTVSCDAPTDGVADDQDCDDGDAAVSPDADELCNDQDDDCDGDVDEEPVDAVTWNIDYDGDGHGDSAYTLAACDAPSGYVSSTDDCDDTDADVNPDQAEVCDGLDNDCDGLVDDDDPDVTGTSTWFTDADGDGFGDSDTGVDACDAPSGTLADDTDCDDAEALTYPGAPEACDGLDNDCDGSVDAAAEVYGEGEACAGVDCLDILTTRGSVADGVYYVDPDGTGAFQAWCDMTTDGGGWTMVGSFNNNDGTYNWTRYSSDTDNTGTWQSTDTFGDVGSFESADHKSEAFHRVAATDLLALDDLGNWASYVGALGSVSLYDTLSTYSTCTTAPLSSVTVDSSNSTIVSDGLLTFYGGDPNNSDRCAFNFDADSTDSSVIGLAHQGCGNAGFGHVGWYDGSTHYDRDHYFCLGVDYGLNTGGSCGDWYGYSALWWFQETDCDYAMLLVR